MGSENINSGSYAQYDFFDSISYNCISYMIQNDELIWRLLYYKNEDAWKEPPYNANLTPEQKAAMIYNGSDDTTKFNVFLDQGSPDVMTREDCIIRISPHSIFPENRTVGTINIILECYCHYHINTLSNYKTRSDMITKRLIELFNGTTIGGIGKMYFDRVGSQSDRLEWGGQTPFKGRWIIMSNKSN